ncbi:glycosyltransferase family 4 protein [Adhaeribacter soli]|uniref:Glycosyltransferase family 4 protein n=2 Tax=Adhaeribacter soli TaxID=2607655 RepID=A0A5N1JA46_9BACT|nr:glycosyltransferase family 4 protein [Adhaeribacter soli]
MTADTVGGVWTYALELIRTLGSQVQVALATMGAPLSPDQQAEVNALPNVELHESTWKLEWMANPWEDVNAAGQWLLEISRKFEPDLIHLNNFAHGNLPWNKPVLMVAHSCVLSWWQGVKNEKAPEEWGLYKTMVRQGLQAADLVIAPSAAMLREAADFYGPFRQERVIYNGRNKNLFRYAPKEPFIFSMGRIWDEAKNLELLTRVAAFLDWPVYIAGENVHPVTREEVDFKNVYFLGKLSQKEITSWLSRASIFALPARYEPFGLSALEAAFSGCALVLGNIKSQREIWENAACLVDPTDAGVLETTLQKLINDEFHRNIMSCRASKAAHAYSATRFALQYLDAYRQLTKASRILTGTTPKAPVN